MDAEELAEQRAVTAHEESLLCYFFMLNHKVEDFARFCIVVEPGMFYSSFHADVWSTMLRMASDRNTNEWANYLIVAEELAAKPISVQRQWSMSDAIDRLIDISEAEPPYSLAEAHRIAIIVRDHAQQRIVKQAMMTVFHSTSLDQFHNALDDLRLRLNDVQRPITGDVRTVWDGLESWKVECERAQGGAAVNTGWPTIDRAFGLIRGGEVVICAARAGVGKSWGGTSIAVHNATFGRRTLMCTLEMTASEMTERIVSTSLNMAPRDMRLSHENLKVNDAREHLPHLDNIRIYDKAMTIGQIPSVVKQAQIGGFDPDLVIVDYMGLFGWEGNKNALQYERSSEIARSLKTQAKRMGKAVLCLAQLSRQAGDGFEEPRLDMLRDSGAIEEAADRVLLMWKRNGKVCIKVAKNRHGEEGACAILAYTKGLKLEELRAASL
jgi:replicative DNA helicase